MPPPTPTLVLLHHFGGSSRTWGEVVERLGDGFETVALDLPGFGDAADAPGPHTVSSYADHVEDQLRARGTGPFVLIGHSMGGKVALALAKRRPAMLRALVLLAPSPPTPEPIEDEERARLIAGWAAYGALSQTLAAVTACPLPEASQRLAIDDMMRVGRAAWTAWLTHGSREDIAAGMEAIAVPVTILSGSADTVLPTALVRREVADRLQAARMIAVPGAGHLLPLEAPDAVVAAIAHVAGFARIGAAADVRKVA